MHFVTSRIPGNKTQVHTPLGNRVAESEQDVHRIEMEVIEEMTRRLGRSPTKAEMVSGPRAQDDRTLIQKMEREQFRPKRPAPDAMTALADSLESGTTEPNYAGLSLRQRLAADARRISERNQSDAETETKQAEKLSRLKHDLRKIDEAISYQNWLTDRGSQRIVDLLEMTREQLVNGSDPHETRRLRSETEALIAEQAKREQSIRSEAIKIHQAAIASLQDGSNLTTLGEDDPVRYRAEQLMADGADPTSAWNTARAEQE